MEYTVKTIQGCKVIYGQIPMDDFSALLKVMPEWAVMDIQAANHLGAAFVTGMPDNTKKLLDLPPCEELKKQAANAKQNGLSEQASDWLLRGERGSSSETMFAVLTNSSKEHKRAHPHDPDDLRRCRLLLEQVPELASRIGAMATVSKEWAALIAQWDEICNVMDSEAPEWRIRKGRAAKTYALMKECMATVTSAA